MNYAAYFIGGPLDLTKAALSGYPRDVYEALEAVPFRAVEDMSADLEWRTTTHRCRYHLAHIVPISRTAGAAAAIYAYEGRHP